MEPTHIWACKCGSSGGAYGSAEYARQQALKHLTERIARTDLHTAYLGRAADSITLVVGTALDSDHTVVP